MSGSLARRGFRFQDLYLLRRILEEAASSLAADVFGPDGSRRRSDLRFGIEARTSASGSSDWDGIISSVDECEVIEAKSGAITKGDRIAFWRRLRREAHRLNETSIHPVLVADPGREDIEKWQKLGTAAGSWCAEIPTEPSRVSDADDLLAEALWAMCSALDGDRNEPALSLQQALQVLSTFTIAAIDFDQLEASVLDGIELLFPDGLSDQLSDSILGWLNRRAAAKEQPRRLFTIRELLGEMTVLQNCAAFDAGTIARWKAFWTELPALFRQRARTRLGAAGQAIPMREVQPAIDRALADGREMLVIVGQSGGGKTALLAQFEAEARDAGAEIFECNADAISEDEVDDLATSLRFRRALLAIRTPGRRMYILVDALDEAEIGLRIRWSKQLARLGVDSRATLVATIRDNAWRSDGTTQNHLQHWYELTLNDWPEELVRTLLKNAYPETAVSAGLLQLIRHPLMLDIFWRTFVEAPERQPLSEWTPRTRHQLLSVFWQERLIHSARHKISALAQRMEKVIGRAASSIGAFDAQDIDTEILEVMLSESVVVPEGRLNPRYRFRHPLLRDFALGLWCLSANNEASVAECWSLIQGGIQRHGALRSMFEALADAQFVGEHPHLSSAKLVGALLAAHPEAPAHVAQVFGACSPDSAFNPATWPQSVQESLPTSFATELLTSARLAGNFAWAQPAAAWQANASWIDNGFPHELLNFVAWLRQRASTERKDSPPAIMARVAAIKLRQISEHPRFAPQFEGIDHWLKMASMREVIPLVPDEATLAWIEREMPVATWRTRGFLLDQLIHLAPTDSLRTAAVYRKAIGLREENGIPFVDPSYWRDSLMAYHAIDWSLAGKDGRHSLLQEFPTAFMPVAFLLAEALQYEEQPTSHRQVDEFLDDYSAWGFWADPRDLNVSGRCIRAIQKTAENIADTKTDLFFSDVVPLFKASRSLTLQTVYLDLLLSRVESQQFRDALVERVLDGRLYRFGALSYWLEKALAALWADLSREQQLIVLGYCDAIAADETDEGSVFRRSRFLASIPITDLSPSHRLIAAARLADGFQPLEHPRERFRGGVVSPWSDVEYEDERVKDWPEEFDKEQLQIISRVSKALAGEATPEIIQQQLPQGLSAAFQLLPAIAAQPASLENPDRFWLLDALEALLEKHGPADPDRDAVGPPFAFVEACADLALKLLETVPYGPSGPFENNDVWHSPETLWYHALALADSALVRAPARDDTRLQDRFTNVLIQAFSNGDAGVQVTVGWSVRSWHWLRTDNRRTLHNRLVWETPREASVLISSLHTTRHGRDKDRVEIYRSLLTRTDVDSPEKLAQKLGDLCGLYSMVVFTDIGRSGVAALAHEFIDDPDRFPLIQNREARVSFFRSFVFAMKEMAKDHWEKTELASDFAIWSLKIWRLLLVNREKRHESEDILLFAMHWLERQDDEARDPAKLRLWWEQLLPLVSTVTERGARPDCFILFFNLRDPKMQLVLRAEELLAAVDSLLARLEPDIEAGLLELDTTDPANEDHNSWREVLRNAAEALESGRAAGLLRNDFHREKSRHILSRLAATPFSVEAARTALYRLQNESI